MKINQVKVGIVLSYVQIFISSAISLIYTPVMLRLLGQSEYGLYNLVSSVVSYFGLLNFGFISAYVRFYTRAKQESEDAVANLNGIFILVFSLMGLVALIAGGVLVFNAELVFKTGLTAAELEKSRILLAIMMVNLAITFPVSVLSAYVSANERFFFQRILSIVNSLMSPMIGLPLLLLGYQSIGLALASFATILITTIIRIYYSFVKLHMKVRFHNMDFSVLKEVAGFSFFIFLQQIVDQINWSVDKYIIARVAGTASVAIYAVGSSLNSYYLTFSNAISNVFVPRINRIIIANKKNAMNEIQELFTKVGRIQALLLFLIFSGIVFFGRYFITQIYAGESYTNSYYIALLLLFPMTFPLIQDVGVEIQRAKNMHRFQCVLYLFSAIANLGISIPLCIHFSEIGSAAGTFFTLIVANVIIMNFYYQYKIKLDVIYFWREIAKMTKGLIIPSILGIVIVKLGIHSHLSFVLLVLLYTVCYIISMWHFAMNDYEKGIFRKLFNKLGVKV